MLLQALIKEWQLLNISLDSEIVSIYFGGGTPSLFGPKRIGALLKKIYEYPQISSDCEITLEANPCEVTKELIKDFAKEGINRVSLGVQSLSDRSLITIGREHNVNRSIDAIYQIKEAGICNISIDLMYDRPLQTLEEWIHELDQLDPLPITHLSLYNLTIEEGSAYKRKEKAIHRLMPTHETSLELFQAALRKFESIGLKRYEISAFSKPGFESRHNLGYWQGRSFYGLGPSAFSYIDGSRKQNICNFPKYLELIDQGKLAYDFIETLSQQESQQEMLAVGLRVACGVSIDQFEKTFGLLSEELKQKIKSLIDSGYISSNDKGSYLLTEKGQLFYDDVGAALM